MRSSQIAGNKPLKTTTYTSGTGTYVPLVPGSWVRLTVVGGGAGGSGYNVSGVSGPGGATVVAWIRLSGPVDWAIGAGGLGGQPASAMGGGAGGTTHFGAVRAAGGPPPINVTVKGGGDGVGGVVTAGGDGLANSRGGNSLYGVGGDYPGGHATGYGAGGGGFTAGQGGNGSGGLIIVEEFGA